MMMDTMLLGFIAGALLSIAIVLWLVYFELRDGRE